MAELAGAIDVDPVAEPLYQQLIPLLVSANRHAEADAYYGSVLTLFGAGWDQGRYRFAADGTLQPGWSESCQAD